MKIFNFYSKEQGEQKKPSDDALTKLLQQVGSSLGISKYRKQRSYDVIKPRLQSVLDDHFALLCDYPLPDVDVHVPLILVGPPGVQVLYPSALRGIYRAKGRSWYMMNDRKHQFEPVKENPVALTDMLAQALRKFLRQRGVELDDVEPVLLFTDPGVHVDIANPVVRIVLHDAIQKFAAGQMQAPALIDEQSVDGIITLITHSSRLAAEEPDEHTPPFTTSGKAKRPLRFHLATWQWVVVVVMLLLWFAMIMAFLVFLLPQN